MQAQVDIKIKKLHANAVVPEYAHATDAGLDLVATTKEFLEGVAIYGTGLALEIPQGYVGLIFPRSSILKNDMSLVNSVGVIDSGYRGEIKLNFSLNHKGQSKLWTGDINDALGQVLPTSQPVFISKVIEGYEVGDRIGQLIVVPYPKVTFQVTEYLSPSDRGENGFGSTGS